MAIAVTNIGTSQNKTPVAPVVTVPAGGVPAGAVIFAGIANDNTTPASGLSDTAGNSYSGSASSASSFNSLAVYWAWNATAALVSGNTITCGTPSATGAVAMTCFYATGLKTSANPLDVQGTASGSSTTPSASTSAGTAGTGELIVGFVESGGPSGDTFTQDSTNEGGFATPPTRVGTTGGSANSNRTVAGGTAIWTGSGTATYAPTLGTSRAWNEFVGAFLAGTAPPPPTITGNTLPLMGVA